MRLFSYRQIPLVLFGALFLFVHAAHAKGIRWWPGLGERNSPASTSAERSPAVPDGAEKQESSEHGIAAGVVGEAGAEEGAGDTCQASLLGRLAESMGRQFAKIPPNEDRVFQAQYEKSVLASLPQPFAGKLETAYAKRPNESVQLSDDEIQSLLNSFDAAMTDMLTELAKRHPLAIDLASINRNAKQNGFSVRRALQEFNLMHAQEQQRLLKLSMADHYFRYLAGAASRDGLPVAEIEKLRANGQLSSKYDLKRGLSLISRHKTASTLLIALTLIAAPVASQVGILWGSVRSSWDLVGAQQAADLNAKIYSMLASKMHDPGQKAAAKRQIERLFSRHLTNAEFEALFERATYKIVAMEYFESARNTPAFRVGSALFTDYLTSLNSYIMLSLELQNRLRFLAEDTVVLKRAAVSPEKLEEQTRFLEAQKRALAMAYRGVPAQLAAVLLARSYGLVGDRDSVTADEVEPVQSALDLLLNPEAFNFDRQWDLAVELAETRFKERVADGSAAAAR